MASESTSPPKRDFLNSFTHYIRTDIAYNSTNPNAPYEVIEHLHASYTQLCASLTSPPHDTDTNNDSDSNAYISSATQWHSLFAFSHHEAQNSAAAGQVRGCLLAGLTFGGPGGAMPAALEWARSVVAGWEREVRAHRVHVDEPKAPALSSKVVARGQLGQLVPDVHMWPQQQRQQQTPQATVFRAGTGGTGPEPTSDFYIPDPSASQQAGSGSGSGSEKKALRSSEDVLKRLRWDGGLDADDYAVVYLDRFVGYLEAPVSRWRSDTSDDEFVPMHRITGFRRVSTGEVVWSREARLDKIFNT